VQNPFEDISNQIAELKAIIQVQGEAIRKLSPAFEEPIDIKEAAAFCKIAVSTMRDHVGSGYVPHHRAGGKLLFYKSELNEWIRE
jgi:excisionase family DNA binding protein